MPFMVMADGASRDARLLQRQGGRAQGSNNEFSERKEQVKGDKWEKNVIEKETE